MLNLINQNNFLALITCISSEYISMLFHVGNLAMGIQICVYLHYLVFVSYCTKILETFLQLFFAYDW